MLDRSQIQKVGTASDEDKEALQAIFDSTFKRVLTRDRKPDDEAPETEEMPYRLQIVQIFRSEHAGLYHRLHNKRAEVRRPFQVKTAQPDTKLNRQLARGESYLFHGTNPSAAMSILRTGFILEHAGSTTGMMYGAGVYCAECTSKADEYSHDDGGNTYPSLHAILVNRCFVGVPLIVNQAGPHTDSAAAEGKNCVVGDRETKVGTYREFIFFDGHQVYPEYTVIYRRQYEPVKDKIPPEMVVPTKGTTGRFWQIKVGDSGWKNLPTELNNKLLSAMSKGENNVEAVWSGTEYIFDLEAKQGTNKRTGNSVPLRAPMHK